MSSLPGIIGLLTSIYVRPHELFDALSSLNVNYVFLALSILGIANDVRRRRARLTPTPLLPYVLAFAVWCALSVAVRGVDVLVKCGTGLVVSTIVFLVLSHGIQRLPTLRTIALTILSFALFVAYVGIEQGLSPLQCVVYDPADKNSRGYADGRECVNVDADGVPHPGFIDCMQTGHAGLPYVCERVGPFGTTSVGGGRVRYLGVLLDPNDLALATAMAMPFSIAFFEMRRSMLRFALLSVSLAGAGVLVVFTQSRGGMLTFAAVLGAYFVKKYGLWRGAVAGGVLAVPVLLVGGRSDESAAESTLERLGCACAGLKMLVSSPVLGVGYQQFTEHHNLTAHNAYILAAAELGAPGLWLFATILYLAIKIPLGIVRFETVESEEARTSKALAMAMLSALAGAAAGIYFLSWTYHYILWIYLGLSGALYTAHKRAFPAYECRLTVKEGCAIAIGWAVVLAGWAQYIKLENAWE